MASNDKAQTYQVTVRATRPTGWLRGGVAIPNSEAGISLEVDEATARQLQIDAALGMVHIVSGADSLPMSKEEVDAAKTGRPAPAKPAARVVETARVVTPAPGDKLAAPGDGTPGDMQKKSTAK